MLIYIRNLSWEIFSIAPHKWRTNNDPGGAGMSHPQSRARYLSPPIEKKLVNGSCDRVWLMACLPFNHNSNLSWMRISGDIVSWRHLLLVVNNVCLFRDEVNKLLICVFVDDFSYSKNHFKHSNTQKSFLCFSLFKLPVECFW